MEYRAEINALWDNEPNELDEHDWKEEYMDSGTNCMLRHSGFG